MTTRTLTFMVKAKNGERYTPLSRGDVLARISIDFDEDNFMAWCGGSWEKFEFSSLTPKIIEEEWFGQIKALEMCIRNDMFQSDATVKLVDDSRNLQSSPSDT